jgi:hypothetical protein
MQGQGTQGAARARILRTVCCVLREASTVCCVLRAAPQGRAAGAAPIKRDRRQAARGSATRGKYEARSTSMRCALDIYRLREGARLLAERCARSPGSARVCAREIRTSKDVINLAPQQEGDVSKCPHWAGLAQCCACWWCGWLWCGGVMFRQKHAA